MMHAVRITVHEDMREEVEAWVRQKVNLKTDDHQFDPKQTRYGSNLVGEMGAWATAAYLGAKWRDEVFFGGDDGVDLELGPWSVEVKTTRVRWGGLLVNSVEAFRAHLAVLAYVSQEFDDKPIERLSLLGWVSRRRFLDSHEWKDCGHGKRLYMKQADLSHIRDLRAVWEVLREEGYGT
jgi:hypothetical protein